MTIPTDASNPAPRQITSRRRVPSLAPEGRSRRLVAQVAGVLGGALLLAILVGVFPALAVPLGVALAFLAAVPPLAQWLLRR
jgi:hypothetical protein